ncbi:hypothetical protein ODJ79_14015 [Actinoplanes sp. KI2]|uniref:hypothetical protein n=1 Tax=Actinoplanes sp. KI2 TaxID=2983315 RepID=UPI0021D6006C|nr:hypothetical protein [Actinoplanes sp. KI2]MCU7724837.1 hypothetical protein [Actinoplanes sp. KI2]
MSLFRAANNVNTPPPTDPYPINRPREDTIPDGPTERIDERTARRRRDRVAWLGVLVAVFALVTSSIAVFAGWRAMNLARLVATTMTAGAGAPAAGPRTTGFTVTYAQEPLRVQVGCSAVLFLDLDEPRANADEKVSDLRYDSRCGQDLPRLTLGPGAAAGAQVKDGNTDAEGCQQAIRNSPIGPGGSVEVRKGVTLCVLTAAIPPSMSLVEVTDVGATGTAGMRATSWKVEG